MRGDPLRRLAALHSRRAGEAAAWLSLALWDEEAPRDIAKHLDCSIDEFERVVNDAICVGDSDVKVPTEVAEAVAVALKNRKRSRGGRPVLTRVERIRNRAVVMTARMLKAEKIKGGMSPGQAEEQAAEEMATRIGHPLSAATIRRRMSEADKNR